MLPGYEPDLKDEEEEEGFGNGSAPLGLPNPLNLPPGRYYMEVPASGAAPGGWKPACAAPGGMMPGSTGRLMARTQGKIGTPQDDAAMEAWRQQFRTRMGYGESVRQQYVPSSGKGMVRA